MSTTDNSKDIIGGAAVVAIGAGFLLFSRDLDMGSAARMGPGYFPTILSGLMIMLGAVMAALALRRPAGEDGVGPLPWRGLLLVIGATAFFGFALRGLGLGPSTAIVVFATAWASRYARLSRSVPLALGLAAFCAFLFIRLLGLPLPLLGPWLGAAA
jgi:putative tricarboxylic transport membrane protein